MIEGIEKVKSKYEQLKEIEEEAKFDQLSEEFAQMGIDINKVLEGSEEEFQKFKAVYVDALKGTSETGLIDSINKVAEADLSGTTTAVKDTASAMSELSTSSSTAASNVSTVSSASDSLSTSVSKLKDVDLSKLKSDIQEIVNALNGFTGANSFESFVNSLNSLNITTLTSQFTSLIESIKKVTSAIDGSGGGTDETGTAQSDGENGEFGGGASSIKDALKNLQTTANDIIGESGDDGAKGTGLIGKFGQLTTAIDDVSAAIGLEKVDSEAQTLLGAMARAEEVGAEKLPALKGYFDEIKEVIAEMLEMLNEFISALDGLGGFGGFGSVTPHYKGTVGKAFAKGYPGLKHSEKNALRSEFGQPELTVYPNGTYELTTEPTIDDLPKGTVIFNHKQVAKMMKGGKGKAFANGTNTPMLSFGGQMRSLDEIDALQRKMVSSISNTLLTSISHLSTELDGLTTKIAGYTNNTSNQSKNITLSVGDIVVQGVQDTDSFAKAVVERFPTAILQEIHKH